MRAVELVTPVFLEIGHPKTKKEFQAMFQLRADEYRRRGYITTESDIDEYDLEGKCAYFIARIEGKIVGTARLIIDDPLPTEKYFEFKEPSSMKSIPRNQRGEISRLVVIAGKMNHLVLWHLIKAIVEFGQEEGLQGGYAFIKRGLNRIIESVGIPIHRIRPFTLRYEEELLHGYFYNGSPVVPIYYLRDEVADAMERIAEKYGTIESLPTS